MDQLCDGTSECSVVYICLQKEGVRGVQGKEGAVAPPPYPSYFLPPFLKTKYSQPPTQHTVVGRKEQHLDSFPPPCPSSLHLPHPSSPLPLLTFLFPQLLQYRSCKQAYSSQLGLGLTLSHHRPHPTPTPMPPSTIGPPPNPFRFPRNTSSSLTSLILGLLSPFSRSQAYPLPTRRPTLPPPPPGLTPPRPPPPSLLSSSAGLSVELSCSGTSETERQINTYKRRDREINGLIDK